MAFATNVQKNLCQDCKKELKTGEDKQIIDGFRLIYDTEDGKIEAFKCKECFEKDKSLKNYRSCEVYSRIVGYLRPIQQWNVGKQREYNERKEFNL